MQYPIKSASLSRHALTCHHGRLLQDSGFTKRGSTPNLYADLAHTFTNLLGVSSYQSRTVTGRLSSGKPAMQSIRRVAVLSTSARQFLEIASMYSMEERIWALRSALQKTSSQPLKWEQAEGLSVTQSWAHSSDNTPLHFSHPAAFGLRYGLTPMALARQLGKQSLSNYALSVLKSRISEQPTIPSTTA